ncbi:hypothetical protein ABPG72_011183 [Tetrahymena utriculariae]
MSLQIQILTQLCEKQETRIDGVGCGYHPKCMHSERVPGSKYAELTDSSSVTNHQAQTWVDSLAQHIPERLANNSLKVTQKYIINIISSIMLYMLSLPCK